MSLQDTPDDPVAVASREASARFYRQMEERLRGADYLAGPYSFADIAFYMAQLFGARMGAGMSEDTPNLIGWRDRVGESSGGEGGCWSDGGIISCPRVARCRIS